MKVVWLSKGTTKKAFHLFQSSLDQGNPECLYGCLSLGGHGVELNFMKAFRYFEEVQQFDGHGEAYCKMGQIYELGAPEYNIPQDYKEAMKMYLTAVNLARVGLGATCMGSIYLEGRKGIDVNHKMAYQWFKKASSMNDPSGHFCLGFMYLHGLHVSVDLERALDLFKKSLKGGYAFAQFEIDMVELIKSTATMLITVTKDDYKSYSEIVNAADNK